MCQLTEQSLLLFKRPHKNVLLLGHVACTLIWNMYPPKTQNRKMKEKLLKQKAALAGVVFRKALISVTLEKLLERLVFSWRLEPYKCL